jgi:hypothetical protein
MVIPLHHAAHRVVVIIHVHVVSIVSHVIDVMDRIVVHHLVLHDTVLGIGHPMLLHLIGVLFLHAK